MTDSASPVIYVLAGTNGAGKSSVAGEMFRECGREFYDPDLVAREILASNPGATQEQANIEAWEQGKRFLERAIATGGSFAFETTLGGRTIPGLLEQAARRGIQIHVWYVGLNSPEQHIDRVRRRVALGGHDIPEWKIRQRYESSREHLIALLSHVTRLRLFDNSREGDPAAGVCPSPVLLLDVERRKILYRCCPTPDVTWAEPIINAALAAAR